MSHDENIHVAPIHSHRVESIAEVSHTYLPLLADFIREGHVLPFDLYERVATNELVLFHPKGKPLPADIHTFIRESNLHKRIFARADCRHALVAYQEKVIVEVLRDLRISVDARCEAAKSMTTSLSELVHHDPSTENIQRYRVGIQRLVDFTFGERTAMRILLQLAHHDYYTFTHSVNVGFYGLAVALAYYGPANPQHDIREIAFGLFMHDIGKCRVDPDIITKPSSLSDEEWNQMKKHPNHGCTLLASRKILSDELQTIVQQHHERPDGKGYPLGTKGDGIHAYARICSVADAFDALTTDRSYRRAFGAFEALNIMKKDMDGQFDPRFYKLLVRELHNVRRPTKDDLLNR